MVKSSFVQLFMSGFSFQLIFARTKIVLNLSIPRAELEAALLNASIGHLVHLSMKNMHNKCMTTAR